MANISDIKSWQSANTGGYVNANADDTRTTKSNSCVVSYVSAPPATLALAQNVRIPWNVTVADGGALFSTANRSIRLSEVGLWEIKVSFELFGAAVPTSTYLFQVYDLTNSVVLDAFWSTPVANNALTSSHRSLLHKNSILNSEIIVRNASISTPTLADGSLPTFRFSCHFVGA